MTREKMTRNSLSSSDSTFNHPCSFLQAARIIQDWLSSWSILIIEGKMIHTQ